MSDSAATDNFARPFTRERTEFGSDPDFSPASISKTHREWEKSIPRPAEIRNRSNAVRGLYLPWRSIISIMCGTLLDSAK